MPYPELTTVPHVNSVRRKNNMSIKNFDFPGTTLRQEFVEASTGNTPTLAAVIVGRQYITHRADVESEAVGWGETVIDASNGKVFSAYPDGIKNVENIDTANAKVIIRDALVRYVDAVTSGVTLSGATLTFTSSLPAKLAVGDYLIVTISTTATIVKVMSFNATSKTVTIDNTTLTGTVASVEFCRMYSEDIEVSPTLGTSSVTIAAVTAAIEDLSSSALPVVYGKVYLSCRESTDAFVNKLGSVERSTEVASILGNPCKDNPLAAGVYAAAAAANGSTVYFTAVSADTQAAYNDAMALLDRYRVYSVVPCTDDTSIAQYVHSANYALSLDEEIKEYRTTWLSINTSVADRETAVADLIAKRPVSSYRAQVVFADDILFNGEIMPNYFAAAAAAGMRSYEPVHRPLSNLTYNFFSVKDTHHFTRAQLKEIASNGIWIVGNNADGVPVNMRQITSAMANDLNQDEESIISNADEIAYTLSTIGEKQAGNSNISPLLLDILDSAIKSRMNAKLGNGSNPYVGPQLLDWELLELYQDSVNLDWVYATIVCTPPKPFNKFKMTLRIV